MTPVLATQLNSTQLNVRRVTRDEIADEVG
jgi:hypothetical protein